ncbi:MAG TPA: DUF177 domain-containing protein [Myxococcota bacterium]|nr:DUF177 domain-containing protein [Myxococcota bacterium]HND28582.1 DUF177 domain-containing protein [Myxococcota bacterium]
MSSSTENVPTFPRLAPDAVPPHGLQVELGPWAVAPAGEGAEGTVEGLSGRLKVTRHSGVHFVVRGEISGQASLLCDRCRRVLSLPIAGNVDCLYSPVSTLPEREEDADGDFPMPIDLPQPVDDQGEYDGVALDLRDVVREFFALERPVSLRCSDVDSAFEVECLERWRSVAGTLDDGMAAENPFAALAGFKPPR